MILFDFTHQLPGLIVPPDLINVQKPTESVLLVEFIQHHQIR